MPRPPKDQRITDGDFSNYSAAGLISPVSTVSVEVQGQAGTMFKWKISDKASTLVSAAVVDYLSASAFGETYSVGAAFNKHTREVNLVVFGEQNAESFLEHISQDNGRSR